MNAAEIGSALGNARREGQNRRCRCPLHGGNSLTLRDGRTWLLVKPTVCVVLSSLPSAQTISPVIVSAKCTRFSGGSDREVMDSALINVRATFPGVRGIEVAVRHRSGMTNARGELPVGIDVRGEGGYILAAPSPTWTPAEGKLREPNRLRNSACS